MPAPDVYELQCQVGIMVSRFQDTIKQFDELKKNVTDVVKTNKILDDLVKFLNEKHQLISDDLKQFGEKCDENCANLNRMSDYKAEYFKNLNQMKTAFDEKIKEVHDYCIKLDIKSFKFERDFKNFVPNEDHQSLLKQVASLEDKLSNLSALQKNLQDSLDKNIEYFSAYKEELKHSINLVQMNLDSYAGVQRVHLVDHDLHKIEIDRKLNEMQDSLKNHVSDAIGALPKPIEPLSLEDAQKSMQGKLEPVSLDARNANLRSANNETKITILEKKIEQLSLLVNKLQLQGNS
jgi:hypothetical protein